MEKTLGKKWVYGLTAAFLLLNSFLIVKQFFWLSLLPVVIAVIGMAFYSLDKLLYLTVFLTPLSISVEELDLGVSMNLPTEPLFFGIMLLFFLKLMIDDGFDTAFLRHPLTLMIGLQLAWMLMTSVSSSMPIAT